MTATPPLSPKLRARHVTMIALGGIIGASLFVGSGNIIRSVGPAAVLSYLAGGLLAFLVMRMLGELAAANPAVGSFMEYARTGLGPWAGYLVGWLYWYFWVGIIAYESILGGETLHAWFGVLPAWAWAILLPLTFTAVNMLSVRAFGEVEFWLASIKVITIAVFLVGGVTFALGLWPHSTLSVANLWQYGGIAPHGWGTALAAVAIVVFSFFGAEIAVMAAAESEQSAAAIRQATHTIIWRIMLFFVGSVLVIVTVLPWHELPPPTDAASAPFTLVFERFGLPGAAVIMQLVIFSAVVSVLNSGLYSAARMCRALAQHGFAPPQLGRVSQHGVPRAALVVSVAASFGATVVQFTAPSANVFAFIMNSGGLVALVVYGFIALTQLRARHHMSVAEQSSLTVKAFGYPWANWVVFAAIVSIVALMLSNDAGRAQVVASSVAIVVIAAAWPLVVRSRRARTTRDAASAVPHHSRAS